MCSAELLTWFLLPACIAACPARTCTPCGRWPPQVDVQRATRVLWEAYESARALPMHMLALLKDEAITPQYLAKRLNGFSRERVEWLVRAELGDVR